MPIEQRIYLFSQGSEPSFHEVVSGVIERTYTDNLGVLAVIKTSDPEQSRTIETCSKQLHRATAVL